MIIRLFNFIADITWRLEQYKLDSTLQLFDKEVLENYLVSNTKNEESNFWDGIE
jgi:hypothetical protein